MPTLTIEGHGTFEVLYGKRLVLAIEDTGFDILHRCGGFAKCTTCRTVFIEGEPDRMTVAERDRLTENGVLGEFRLSCQCLATHDMHVQPLMRLSTSGLDDAGLRPEEHITPDPEWISVPEHTQA